MNPHSFSPTTPSMDSIRSTIQDVFRDVFEDDTLQLRDDLLWTGSNGTPSTTWT